MVDEHSDFLDIKDNFRKTAHVSSVCMKERTEHREALVTIAIPTYNDLKGLQRAVNSALSQQNYEDYNIMIVSNSRFLQSDVQSIIADNRISYYENEDNIGMCGNWNRCIELSQAKWTVMLHDDDCIMPNYLEEVMKIIAARPDAGMVQTARTYYPLTNIDNAKLPFERFDLLDIFPGGQLHAPTGMLMRTNYIKALGGWNEEYTNLFDYWFNALFLVHYPVYVTPQKLTDYRFSMDRYPHDVRLTLIIAEHWLFYKAMLYCHFPHVVAAARAELHTKGLCNWFEVSPEELPFTLPQYNEGVKQWSRRYFKYARLFAHNWTNMKDRGQCCVKR